MADRMTPAQRSALMAGIRGKDTKPELALRSALHRRSLRFRKHVKTLPGCPDIVFVSAKVVVFVDGDFWHGYRFPAWSHKLSPYWRDKIEGNRRRDRRNFRRLRAAGWTVVRVWEHDVTRNLDTCADRVVALVTSVRGKSEQHTGRQHNRAWISNKQDIHLHRSR